MHVLRGQIVSCAKLYDTIDIESIWGVKDQRSRIKNQISIVAVSPIWPATSSCSA